LVGIRIGTVDVPARIERERYFAELDYLELSALFAGPQKPSSLAKWKAVAPDGALGLVAPFPITHRRAPDHPKPWPSDATTGDFRDSPLARDAFAVGGLGLRGVGAGGGGFGAGTIGLGNFSTVGRGSGAGGG